MKRKILGVSLIAVLIITVLVVVLAKKILMQKPRVVVTVFMHGTVGSTFNILNPFQCISDSVSDQTYCVKTIKRYRNHVAMRYDQILGDLGLHEFCPQNAEKTHAGYYLIHAYDEIAHFSAFAGDVNKYCMFGWSGLLSHTARQEAAKHLYQDLIEYRKQLKEVYGIDPEIRIVTHSHGGNVALLLAEVEKEEKQNLSIDMLFMLGTPVQVETAHLIKSLLFKTIILGYSQGDSVQGSDYFSTKKRKSFMRMSDLVDLRIFSFHNPGYVRADMQFIVNDDPYRVTHTNMWLVGRSTPILDFMDPLPLVVLLPLYASSVKACDYCFHYQACLQGDLNFCSTHIVSCTEMLSRIPGANQKEDDLKVLELHGKHLAQLLFKWRNRLLAEWQSDDLSRHIMFNYKNAQAIGDALFSS